MCLLVLGLPGCKRHSNPETPTAAQPSAGDTESVRTRYLTIMNIGKARYESGATTEAVRSFEQAVALLPTEVAARLNLARACLRDSAFERTIAECSRVIKIDRYATSAYYLAGLAYLRLGKSAEATAKLERAARDDPSTAAVQFQFGAALLMDGQPERAAEAFRATLQLNPGHWSAHYKLALIAQRAKDAESYRTHMLAFQTLHKNMPERQQAPDFWQRCKHTAIEVPTEVHQPDAQPITVRFVAKTLNLDDTQRTPLAVADVDDDGRNDVFALNANGEVQLLHNTASSLFADSAIATVGVGVIGSLCRVADFDNNGGSDVFLGDGRLSALLVGGEDGSYRDVTQASGLNGAGVLDATWVDFDQDGDVDLLTVNSDNSLTLWVNRGNGTFIDGGAEVGVSPLARGARVWPADMDNDEQTDVVVTAPDRPSWQLHNDGLGEFEAVQADPPWPAGTLLIVEDFDNDLSRDIVVARGDTVDVRLGGGVSQSFVAGRAIVEMTGIDYDNDGWLDLLVACSDGTLQLFRNAGASGWPDVSDATGLSAARTFASAHVIVADLDGDGDSDLLFNGPSGAPALWSNEGGNAHAQLRLTLTGTKSNKSALGTLVEVSAGSFQLSRTVTRFPVEIGVGSRNKLDSVRTIWPNGIVKHDIWVDPSKPLKIEEPFVSAGSCPYVYAWDGASFRFITDILGSSPLGLTLRRGAFVPADTDETIWVGNDRTFVPRNGRYVLQISDELREVLYLDHVSLVAVDHPSDEEAHSTSKVQPPPFPDAEVWVVRHRQGVVSAVDNSGRDWTEALRRVDGVRTQPPALEKPQLRGRAIRHGLELNFGRIDVSKPLVLVLTGWLMWGDAGVNVASAQNPDMPNPWPTLDAWAGGAWQPVAVQVGTPAGKTKSILVDLAGRLPSGTTKLRLTTAFELYWDRIALFERATDHNAVESGKWKVDRLNDRDFQPHDPLPTSHYPRSTTAALNMTSADLGWRGFPVQVRPDETGPVLPDTTDIRNDAPWRRTLSGWCTRYGNIAELLADIDDRYAIFNAGDAATIEFAGTLPPLPAGWTRDFFMDCDGWDKDGDYNVAFGDTVKPLPFHGMDDQRYGEQRLSKENAVWIKRYNTRWVEH